MPNSLSTLRNSTTTSLEEIDTLRTQSQQESRTLSTFWKGGYATGSGPISCWPPGQLASWTHVLWFRIVSVPLADPEYLYEVQASGNEGEEEYGPSVRVMVSPGSNTIRVSVNVNPQDSVGENEIWLSINAPINKDNCLVLTQSLEGSDRVVRAYLNGTVATDYLAAPQSANFGPGNDPLLGNNGFLALGGDINSTAVLNGSAIIHALGFSRNTTSETAARALYKQGHTFDFRYGKFDWLGGLTNYWNTPLGSQVVDEVGEYHLAYTPNSNAIIQPGRIVSVALPVIVTPNSMAGSRALQRLNGACGTILKGTYLARTGAIVNAGAIRLSLKDGLTDFDIFEGFKTINDAFELDLELGGVTFKNGLYAYTDSTSSNQTAPVDAFVHLLVALDT